MEKQFILVAIRGTQTKPVFGPAIAKMIAFKKKELIGSGNWKGYVFQLRTESGYANVKILTNTKHRAKT